MNAPKSDFSSFRLFDEDDSIEQLIDFYGNSDDETREIIYNVINGVKVEEVVEEVENVCEIGDISLLWIKAVLNFRKNTILRGLESVRINDDEAQMPNFTFSKRK